MSDYLDGSNLDVLDVATPLDGASAYELALAVRQIKSVLKAVIQHSHKPNGALKGGTITELGAGAVGEEQLINGAVTVDKLGLGAVVSGKIGALAVSEDKIASGAVTETKYAPASIPSSAFKPNSIPLTALSQTFSSGYFQDRSILNRHLSLSCVSDTNVSDLAVGKLTGGVDGQFLFNVGGTWTPVSAGGSLTYDPVTNAFSINSGLAAAYFADVKTSGTPGGTGSTGDWVQRVLAETADMDQADIITFNSNYFVLDIGTYFIHARCPASVVGNHKARLMKCLVADGSSPTVVSVGSNAKSVSGGQTDSVIECYVSAADSLWKYYIEHWIATSASTSDLGAPASIASVVEIYTQGYVIKVA